MRLAQGYSPVKDVSPQIRDLICGHSAAVRDIAPTPPCLLERQNQRTVGFVNFSFSQTPRTALLCSLTQSWISSPQVGRRKALISIAARCSRAVGVSSVVWCWKRPHRSFHETLKSGVCSSFHVATCNSAGLSGQVLTETESNSTLGFDALSANIVFSPSKSRRKCDKISHFHHFCRNTCRS